jgi:hypothetical protein
MESDAMRLSQMRSFRDVLTRFRENWLGYVHEYRLLLVLVLLASLADMASTIYFMLSWGPAAEGHPAVRMFSEAYGPVFGPLLGKTVQFLTIIGVTVFLRRWALFILISIIILYTWAAWYNVWGHALYHPRLLDWLEHLAI